MNFFEAQEKARSQTNTLVFLFICGVIGVVIAVNALAVLVAAYYGVKTNGASYPIGIHVVSTVATVLLILGGTWYKMSALEKNGGSALAEELGASLVESNTQDEKEKRLLNVVEEMAIASGMPVPMVYVMNDSTGINGFAAGNSPTHSVIAVTRGALDRLKRDELQALVAHEFGHIKNYDVLLNMRIIGFLWGLFLIHLLGRFLLDVSSRTTSRSRNSKNGNPFTLIGFGLLLIGIVGYWFGKFIQAAISRGREYLADASAVQFTRQTLGLAGLFKKIQDEHLGYDLNSTKQTIVAHMLFLGNTGNFFSRALATHPPLEERLARLGKQAQAHAQSMPSAKPGEPGTPQRATTSTQTLRKEQLVGLVMQSHSETAAAEPPQKQQQSPQKAAVTLSGYESSIGTLMSYFMAADETTAVAQMKHVRECETQLNCKLAGHIVLNFNKRVPSEQRYELLLKLVPQVRAVKSDQRKPLLSCILNLIAADQKITLLEAGYAAIFAKILTEHGTPMSDSRAGESQQNQIRVTAENYLKEISQSGHTQQPWNKVIPSLLKLNFLSAAQKQIFITNLVSVFQDDEVVTPEEFETLRCFCLLLDAPVPPLS